MTEDNIIRNRVYELIVAGEDEQVLAALREHRRLFGADGWGNWLETAAAAGRVRLVHWLVEAGADIDPPESAAGKYRTSPLREAAGRGHLEIVRWLIDRGARINYPVDGRPASSALCEAAGNGHLEVVRVLVERGAEVNDKYDDMTPVDHAAMYRQKAVIAYLQSVGGVGTQEFGLRAASLPPRRTEAQLASSAQPSGRWLALFLADLPPVADRPYSVEYEFGMPATAEQLAAAETALGIGLPADVREMLCEFNGIWRTSATARENDDAPNIAFLDTKSLAGGVQSYFANSGNPLPSKKALRQVVWVAQAYGYGDLWGVCSAAIGKLPAGTVVRLDHEVGKLKKCCDNLAEFVRLGRFGAQGK